LRLSPLHISCSIVTDVVWVQAFVCNWGPRKRCYVSLLGIKSSPSPLKNVLWKCCSTLIPAFVQNYKNYQFKWKLNLNRISNNYYDYLFEFCNMFILLPWMGIFTRMLLVTRTSNCHILEQLLFALVLRLGQKIHYKIIPIGEDTVSTSNYWQSCKNFFYFFNKLFNLMFMLGK
jgi:hypothetical protein